jgi:hypothetical protein
MFVTLLTFCILATLCSAKEQILVAGLVEQLGTPVGTYLLFDAKHPVDFNRPEVYLMENVVHPGAPDAITWRNEENGGRTFFLAGYNGGNKYVVAKQASESQHAVPVTKQLALDCLPASLAWDEESQTLFSVFVTQEIFLDNVTYYFSLVSIDPETSKKRKLFDKESFYVSNNIGIPPTKEACAMPPIATRMLHSRENRTISLLYGSDWLVLPLDSKEVEKDAYFFQPSPYMSPSTMTTISGSKDTWFGFGAIGGGSVYSLDTKTGVATNTSYFSSTKTNRFIDYCSIGFDTGEFGALFGSESHLGYVYCRYGSCVEAPLDQKFKGTDPYAYGLHVVR